MTTTPSTQKKRDQPKYGTNEKFHSNKLSSTHISLIQNSQKPHTLNFPGFGCCDIGEFTPNGSWSDSEDECDLEIVNFDMSMDQLTSLIQDEDPVGMAANEMEKITIHPQASIPPATSQSSYKGATSSKRLISPSTPKPSHRSPRKQSHAQSNNAISPIPTPTKKKIESGQKKKQQDIQNILNNTSPLVPKVGNDRDLTDADNEYEVNLAFILTLVMDRVKNRHKVHSLQEQEGKPPPRIIPRYTLSDSVPTLSYTHCYDDWTTSDILVDAVDPDLDDLSDQLNELFQSLSKISVENLGSQYDQALHALLLLHESLRCPRQQHSLYWRAHTSGTLSVSNLLSVLSRLSLLQQSRRILLCLLRTLVGMNTVADNGTWRYALAVHASPIMQSAPPTPVPTPPTTTANACEEESVLTILDQAGPVRARDSSVTPSSEEAYLMQFKAENVQRNEQFLGLSSKQIRDNARRTVRQLSASSASNRSSSKWYTGQHDLSHNLYQHKLTGIEPPSLETNKTGPDIVAPPPASPKATDRLPSDVAVAAGAGKIDVKSLLAKTQAQLRQSMRIQVQNMVQAANNSPPKPATGSAGDGREGSMVVLKPSQMMSNGDSRESNMVRKHLMALVEEEDEEGSEGEDGTGDSGGNTQESNTQESNTQESNTQESDSTVLEAPANPSNPAYTALPPPSSPPALLPTSPPISSPVSNPVHKTISPAASTSPASNPIPGEQQAQEAAATATATATSEKSPSQKKQEQHHKQIVQALLRLFIASVPWKVNKFIFAGKNLLLTLPVAAAATVTATATTARPSIRRKTITRERSSKPG